MPPVVIVIFKKIKIYLTKQIGDNTIIDIYKSDQLICIELLFIKERKPDFINELKSLKLLSV